MSIYRNTSAEGPNDFKRELVTTPYRAISVAIQHKLVPKLTYSC